MEDANADQNNCEKLAEMKMPLILSDYRNWFDASSREFDKINQLRTWEITLVSALSVVLLTGQNISPIASAPIFVIIVMFAFLEAQAKAIIRMIDDATSELEDRMHATSISEFQKNIAYWTFGNSIVGKWRRREMYKRLFLALLKPSLFLWHGGLTIAVIGLVVVLVMG